MLMRAVLTNSIRRRWIDSVGRGGGNELSIGISDMKSVERERAGGGKIQDPNFAK